jgi:hypothetical protein
MGSNEFPWRPLGMLLVTDGLLSEADLERALEQQERTGRLLGEILVARDCVTGTELAKALARQHGVELRAVAASEPQAASVRAEPRDENDGWRPLGQVLVDQGFLTDAALQLALAEQRRDPDRRLGEVLVQGGYLSGTALAVALAEQHGVELGTGETLETELETAIAPVESGLPTYEVLAHEQAGSPLYVSPNFLEAADFACDYVDRKQPSVLQIQRLETGARETVWTYSQERAEEVSASRKSLVETYGFDPTRWNAKL